MEVQRVWVGGGVVVEEKRETKGAGDITTLALLHSIIDLLTEQKTEDV